MFNLYMDIYQKISEEGVFALEKKFLLYYNNKLLLILN